MKILTIYTDGSHLDKLNNGRLGCGGIAVDSKTQKQLDEFSQELIPEYLKIRYGTDNCSNPSAELLGVYCALVYFKSLLSKYDQIIIKSDYIGVQEWMNGTWKIKESYIRKIKEDIDQEIKNQNLSGKLKFQWVKGHQAKTMQKISPDAYWNDKVDSLAKGTKKNEK